MSKTNEYQLFATYNKKPNYDISNVKWLKADLTIREDLIDIFSDIDVGLILNEEYINFFTPNTSEENEDFLGSDLFDDLKAPYNEEIVP